MPVTVTTVPTGPTAGLKLAMLGGGGRTVKFMALLANPLAVTWTLPVVAPFGTKTEMADWFQLVGTAGVPLNVTVLLLWDAPKFEPKIVTGVPI